MSDLNPVLAERLERAFPAAAAPDWSDVLERSRTEEPFRVSRRLLAPALAAAAVFALAAVALLSPWESDGNPVLERALAAVGDGPVLHVVTRERITTGQRYDVETGRPLAVEAVHQSWVDAERGRIHQIERRDGQVVTDAIVPMGGFGPAQTAATVAAEYRSALERGEYRIDRTGTVAGRRVHWLRSNAQPPEGPLIEAAVDAETYELVRIQSVGGPVQSALDFERVESLERDEADFRVRFAPPSAVAQTRPDGDGVEPQAAARVVPGAQWPGRRAGGEELRSLRASRWRATLRPGGPVSGVILTIAYGDRLGTVLEPAPASATGVEIVQTADDSAARRFLTPTGLPAPPPPTGTFDVGAESAPGANYAVATLRKPGVWIVVRASSRELLFETVRSLRPIG